MVTIHPNGPGRERLLSSSGVQAAAQRVADRVAESAKGQGVYVEGVPGDVALPIAVDASEKEGIEYARVTLAHPSGIAVQAKHGLLTRAAAECGLEVTLWYTTKAGVRRTASQAQVDNWSGKGI